MSIVMMTMMTRAMIMTTMMAMMVAIVMMMTTMMAIYSDEDGANSLNYEALKL